MAIAATYISTNSFSVDGDLENIFTVDRIVKANCASDGFKYSPITNSVYSDITSLTTVTLQGAVLTPNLQVVLVGIVQSGIYGSLPFHDHTASDGQGGTLSSYFLVAGGSITGDIILTDTTNANQKGIIYKTDKPFIHNFNYGDNGTVTTEGQNLFIGKNAGNLTMGSTATLTEESSYNIFIGEFTGYNNTKGNGDIFIGPFAGYNNTDGDHNIFIGNTSGYDNTTGNNNIFIGFRSGYNNIDGTFNIFIGNYTGYLNTTGYTNTFVGYYAGRNNTAGHDNVFLGNHAGNLNTVSDYNTFVGSDAGYYNTNADNNTFIGYASGYNNDTVAEDNTFVGSESGYSNTTGISNIYIGKEAGRYITGGSSPNQTTGTSIFIGNNTKAYADGDSNEIVIGYDATGLGSNTVTLGNDSITNTYLKGSVAIGNTSPDSSAILDLTNTSKGFMPPKMTGSQVEAISNPTFGLIAVATNAGTGDVDRAGWWGYDGANWSLFAKA